jgi:hypothetical protein
MPVQPFNRSLWTYQASRIASRNPAMPNPIHFQGNSVCAAKCVVMVMGPFTVKAFWLSLPYRSPLQRSNS